MRRETPPDVPDLATIQRWMQGVVVHPGPVEEALASPGVAREIPPELLETTVVASWSLDPVERLEIYHGMYLLRLEEALQTDYPALAWHLGEEGFELLVRDYVQVHPSRSYTLNRLGDHLPEYLAGSGRPEAPFLADLARLELAITRVFDGEESPVLSMETLQGVPPGQWEHLRLVPIGAFEMLSLRHDVIPHLKAFHGERIPPRPRRRATWIAVFRRDLAVRHMELTRPQATLLAALAEGQPLGDALADALAGIRSARRQQAVFRWFRDWVSEGIFSSARAA